MHLNLRRVTHVLLLPLTLSRRLMWLLLTNITLSNRGRRMLLSVSLYAHIKQLDPDNLDSEVLDKIMRDINALFKLVKTNERALMIPILLHNRIWKNVALPNEEALESQPMRITSRAIFKSVPAWLRYDEKVMVDDITMVIRKCVGRKLTQ